MRVHLHKTDLQQQIKLYRRCNRSIKHSICDPKRNHTEVVGVDGGRMKCSLGSWSGLDNKSTLVNVRERLLSVSKDKWNMSLVNLLLMFLIQVFCHSPYVLIQKNNTGAVTVVLHHYTAATNTFADQSVLHCGNIYSVPVRASSLLQTRLTVCLSVNGYVSCSYSAFLIQ